MSNISRILTPSIIAILLAGLTACVEEQFGHGMADNDVSDKIINSPAGIVEGELLLFLNADAVKKIENGEDVEILTQDDVELNSLAPVFKISEQNRKYARKYKLDRWYKVNFDGIPAREAASRLAQFGEISRIQFNQKMQCGSDAKATAPESASPVDGYPFNDPMIKDQWNLINTGDKTIASGALEGEDIAIRDVWTKLGITGDSEIVVAILDGPVKHSHPDLKPNMWLNEKELEGWDAATGKGDGKDNDGDGFVDDIFGWNFEQDTCHIDWTKKNETGHGTHVAGIVAAASGNGIGVAGVAGGDRSDAKDYGTGNGVRLMSCQIMEGGISTNASAAAEAFVYAADNGAHIAQCSFGYQNGTYKSDYEYFYNYRMEYYAMQYFLDKDRFEENEAAVNARREKAGLPARKWIIDGPLVIFASGNDGLDSSSYPGALMDCICVSGLGPDGLPAYYTNYGPGCNISAPGGDYLMNPSTGKSQILSTFVSEILSHEDYAYMGGTSMACPHVSAIAALGLQYVKKLNRGPVEREDFIADLLSATRDIDSRLNSGYKDLGVNPTTGAPLDPRPYSAYQYNMGTGAIDAWKFMMNLEGMPVLMVKVGARGSYGLERFFGESASYLTYDSVEMSREDLASLGLTNTPTIENGRLVIDPCKVGSGKITIKAIAGGKEVAGNAAMGSGSITNDSITVPDPDGGMGGMYITREISIVSRGVASNNGGWL